MKHNYMKYFGNFEAVATPLILDNIDTDMIIPKQFLKTIKKTGLGQYLFYEMRYDQNNDIKGDFILNTEPYNKAKILIAGKNFGCGSSREHAPWSLVDFGIKAIIAESFADIFYNNCFKNQLLPIRLKKGEIVALQNFLGKSTEKKLIINLQNQQVIYPNKSQIHLDANFATNSDINSDANSDINLDKNFVSKNCAVKAYNFDIDPFHKNCLIKGLDEINLTLQELPKIDNFESKYKEAYPWLYDDIAG